MSEFSVSGKGGGSRSRMVLSSMYCCESGSFVDEVSVAIAVTVRCSFPHRRFRSIVSDLP